MVNVTPIKHSKWHTPPLNRAADSGMSGTGKWMPSRPYHRNDRHLLHWPGCEKPWVRCWELIGWGLYSDTNKLNRLKVWLRFTIRVLNAGGFLETISFVVISIGRWEILLIESISCWYSEVLGTEIRKNEGSIVPVPTLFDPPSCLLQRLWCKKRYLDRKLNQANKPKHLLQYTCGNARCLNAAKGSDGRAASPTFWSHNWWWQCTHFNVTRVRTIDNSQALFDFYN